MNDAKSKGDIVDQLAEEFLARYRRGERPAVQEYTDKYPEHAAQIRDLFPALVALERVAPACDSESARRSKAPADSSSASLPEQLGDYRIVREIGRGGMGVVYEAEQQALGRRVALKVLLRHAAGDAKVLARFRRESRAAAQLHHTNIVPVFDVGQQGDVCYYAMQFIRGQALDQVFHELQRLRAGTAPGAEGTAEAGPLAHSLWTGEFEPAGSAGATVDPEPGPAAGISEPAPRPAETTAAALPDHSELSSVTSNYQRYCRNVARLGLQVAQALAYAHGRGIIHRDIKPANLLLDTTGILWVSDFGLVKTQDPALTDTGDLVGTLRYMAPERFRGECDTRADVYALGLTLYELLVLRPAFDGKDRLHLVEQIGSQEPARLRTLDPRIPRDLETILMKAIEKDPRRRYPSADDLAEDLRRYLADEPIQARRIGPVERLGRWSRRNPPVASLSAAVVVVTVLGFVGVFGQMQVALAHEQQANVNAAEAKEKEHEANEQRDEAQRQRDEVQALNEKLRATQAQLRSTLYTAHMNLAQHAWEAGGPERVRELLEQHRPKSGEPDLRGFEWYFLYRLCHAELLTIQGTGSSVALNPDGKRLASGAGGGAGRPGVVKVWDVQTGQELLSLKDAGINVAFSPDGKRLASAMPGVKTVKVWDAQTGQELFTLKGGGVGVAFSPDGKRLASDGKEGLKVWDAQTGQELLSLNAHSGDWYPNSRVAFSPDSKRLASADDKTVKVWDAQTGQELLAFKGHTEEISSVAYSPDGNRLVSVASGEGDDDDTVKVWDARTGQELLFFKSGGIVTYSPDGKRLVGSDSDKAVKVWDAQTGQELLSLKGHNMGVRSVVFSPDGKRLVSASWDGTMKVWDAQTDQKPLTLSGAAASAVASVAFGPDGKRLASGGKGRPGSGPGALQVWDAQTGREIITLNGHTAKVTSVAYSPDGKRLATASGDKSVKVWNAQTGQELLAFKGHTGEVTSVAYSPDGKRLSSGGGGAWDATNNAYVGVEVKVWDAQTGQELLILKGNSWPVQSVAFSPDGKRLASACEDKTVKVWDAQTGQELLSLQGGAIVAFSPDGKRLASAGGSFNPLVKVWDAQTGQELLTCNGHTGTVGSVAFSPDGNRLASADDGGRVKVWDAQTGQELLSLQGHSRWDSSVVAFSPDGHRLASNGPDGAVKIWDATPLPQKP